MGKTSIILDVDTGVDDAFAVLFAALHPDINLWALLVLMETQILIKL
jgi:inosine-uridine nucleoside N-ribohydrolase